MLRIIIREILILLGCLSLFPLAVLAAVSQAESPEAAMKLITRVVFSGQILGSTGSLLVPAIRVATPYLIVQALRAFRWSGKSIFARRWAYFYFFLLSALAAVWAFRQSWDLLHLMYALGDLPDEIGQFLEMEGRNVVTFLFCSGMAAYCFTVFLNPAKRAQRSAKPSTPSL